MHLRLAKNAEEIRREEEEAQRRSELVLEIRQQCEDDFLGVRAFVKAMLTANSWMKARLKRYWRIAANGPIEPWS